MLDKIKEEMEVYNYVKEKAPKHFELILRAMTDGVRTENEKLLHRQNKIESGLVVLSFVGKIKNLKDNLKETLKEAYDNCTFFNFDSCKKELEEE